MAKQSIVDSAFYDLLFSALFGAVFALKLQTFYLPQQTNSSSPCYIDPKSCISFDLPSAPLAFVWLIAFSIVFLLIYGFFVRGSEAKSRGLILLKILATFGLAISPWIGWNGSFFLLYWLYTPMKYQIQTVLNGRWTATWATTLPYALFVVTLIVILWKYGISDARKQRALGSKDEIARSRVVSSRPRVPNA